MHILWSFFCGTGIIVTISTVVIAVHEAGHLLAGRLVGYRWKSCAIGLLCITRESGRWRLSASDHWSGGRVRFMTSDKQMSRLQQSIMLLGGVSANFLFGTLLIVYVMRQPLQAQETHYNSEWLGCVAWMSLLSAALNLVPFRLKRPALASDGLQLWRVMGGDKGWQVGRAQRERTTALRDLYAAVKGGTRPRDWDAAQVRQAMALCDDSVTEAMASHYAFYWAADRGNQQESGSYIDKAMALLDTLPDAMRVQILLDAAYHKGLHLREGPAARALVARATDIASQDAEDKALRRSMTLRAEAAALLAEGKPHEAEHTAREALSALEASAMNNVADKGLIDLLIFHCPAPADSPAAIPTASG